MGLKRRNYYQTKKPNLPRPPPIVYLHILHLLTTILLFLPHHLQFILLPFTGYCRWLMLTSAYK